VSWSCGTITPQTVMPSVVSRTSLGFRDQCRCITAITTLPISRDPSRPKPVPMCRTAGIATRHAEAHRGDGPGGLTQRRRLPRPLSAEWFASAPPAQCRRSCDWSVHRNCPTARTRQKPHGGIPAAARVAMRTRRGRPSFGMRATDRRSDRNRHGCDLLVV
jgi:hypothetical protein